MIRLVLFLLVITVFCKLFLNSDSIVRQVSEVMPFSDSQEGTNDVPKSGNINDSFDSMTKEKQPKKQVLDTFGKSMNPQGSEDGEPKG